MVSHICASVSFPAASLCQSRAEVFPDSLVAVCTLAALISYISGQNLIFQGLKDDWGRFRFQISVMTFQLRINVI